MSFGNFCNDHDQGLTLDLGLQGELEDVVPLIQGNQNFSPWIFLPPALCDMLATSTMYVGLNLTFASSFQMLRGKEPLRFYRH